MHRDLSRIVYLARELWPAAATRIEVVTNGLLLHVHPELPKALSDTDTSLYISVHSSGGISPRYDEKISKAITLAKSWQKDFGIDLEVAAQTEWYRGYNGAGDAMTPFEDGDPRKSWDNCVTGQQCFQLFDGRVWKCAPAGPGMHARRARRLLQPEGRISLRNVSKPPASVHQT